MCKGWLCVWKAHLHRLYLRGVFLLELVPLQVLNYLLLFFKSKDIFTQSYKMQNEFFVQVGIIMGGIMGNIIFKQTEGRQKRELG